MSEILSGPRIAPSTLPCAGIPITACSRSDATALVVALALSRAGGTGSDPTGEVLHPTDGMKPALTGFPRPGADIHLCNAYTLALADRSPELRRVLTQAEVNFPDGKSVVWANQLLHRDVNVPGNRVYGPDLFLDVLEAGQECGLRHYLLGGSPAVLASLRQEIARRFPRAAVVGAESPPFRELTSEEREAQDARIRNSGAHVVWVGLGTPKQDHECARLAVTVPAVHLAVGAAFDFVAGAKRQAPVWLRDRGGEWLYRLVSEPRRLWRRYLFGNLRFLRAVAGHRR
jgi:N-acetylglucosaminyldiphosphoundecaprenol N-acetyl-beta-D-mannosaminyltransferase